MKSLRALFLAAVAAMFSTALVVRAADAPAAKAEAASPAGTWKWSTTMGRQGGASIEQTLKLEYKDGKLTGTVLAFETQMGKIPDAAIEEASFKDGVVAFTVTREFNGNKIVTKYEGKLDGDTIKGSRESTRGKLDWDAKRSKEAAKDAAK